MHRTPDPWKAATRQHHPTDVGAPRPPYGGPMTSTRSTTPLRVLIAGGGVAALETLMALHELAGPRVATTLLSPADEFVYQPLSVREPFAAAGATHHPLAAIAADHGAELRR